MARSAEPAESAPAMRYALKLLSARARSSKEIAAALVRKGFLAEQSSVLEQLTQWGYINDARYARERASSLLKMGRMGTEGVGRRLVAAGISQAAAREAVHWAKGEVGFDEVESARTLLTKRGFAPSALAQDDGARFKAARMLRSRGFSADATERLLGPVELDSLSEDD